jgi:hypothetical protein
MGPLDLRQDIVPTRVGVNRPYQCRWLQLHHRPHVRGGEPCVRLSSPPVNRIFYPQRLPRQHRPHARGGEPENGIGGDEADLSSPRAWG